MLIQTGTNTSSERLEGRPGHIKTSLWWTIKAGSGAHSNTGFYDVYFVLSFVMMGEK